MSKKEEIIKFYLNYKLHIFSLVVALSSLILIALVIYPQASKLLSNQALTGDIYKKSNILEAKVAALESYDQEDLNLKLRNVLNSFPVDKDLVNSVGSLQNLAAESGFNINSMVIGLGSGKDGTQSYNIKLELLGPVTSLPIILSNIEGSPRLMRVSSIETTPGKDPQSATVSLQVDILYSSAPSGFGSTDSPLPELSDKDQEVLTRLARASGPIISQTSTPPSDQAPVSTQPLGPRGKENPFE